MPGNPAASLAKEAPWASGTAGSRAERRARHRGESRGYGNKPRSPWGYRQPTPSLFVKHGRSSETGWRWVAGTLVRFGRPKVQSVPPERGPAGGRGGPASAESPSGSGAASSFCVARRSAMSFLVGTGSRSSLSPRFLLSFAGCVAQMVERSLRMRQVLGSMPSASMRERKRERGEPRKARPFLPFQKHRRGPSR